MKTIFNTTQNGFASIKNQISKVVRYFMAGILALMLASCNDNLEVDISPDTIVYNTAECGYSGDILGNGSAFFILDLHNSSNPNIGVYIMGFCTLPSSFANFKLDAGTYRLASNGAVRTLFPGTIADNGVKIGTYLYDFTANKFTFVTEGSLTVTLSGNTYAIAASFKGEDAATGKAVNNIQINFTGQVIFTDDRDLNPAPENSTYIATGTSKWLSSGDRTWSGTLKSVENNGDKWYEISNWGNRSITIYCDDVDGKISIDNYTKVAGDDKYDGYFEVGYLDGNKIHTLPFDEYVVNYDPVTRILDFTGTVTDGGRVHEALVGVAAYPISTVNTETDVVFTDFYANVKLQLTPVSSASAVRQSNNTAAHILKTTQCSSKSDIGAKKTNIVVDSLLKSKIQKNPLKDLRAMDNSQINSSRKEFQKK